MPYLNDYDLQFLGNCSSEDLDPLFQIIVKKRNGEFRLTQKLTKNPSYQLYSPDHKQYWQEIAAELQLYGANTLASIFRYGKGVHYRKILNRVCKKIKLKVDENSSVQEIEKQLLIKILTDSVKKMNETEIAEIIQNLDLQTTDFTKQGLLLALQTAVKVGGFTPYQLAVIVTNSVFKSIFGRGLSLVANASLTRAIGILSGPIGWTITGVWTIYGLAGPAYRVIIPAVIMVSYLRIKYE